MFDCFYLCDNKTVSFSGKKADLYQRDNPDWAPSLHMVEVNTLVGCSDGSMLAIARFERRENRKKHKAEANSVAEEVITCTAETAEADCSTACVDIQTDIVGDHIIAMELELQVLRAENAQLKERIKADNAPFNFSFFEGNNDKVLFFTGLQTWHILTSLYTYICPHISTRKTLTQFQMLVVTLMKMRLNLSNVFLSYIFHVSDSTISRTLSEMIDVMYTRMKSLIIWPSREALWKTMPMQFREHFGKKVTVIIDCFEIFIDRPSNLKARAETWSAYKHHNTIKYLIGITPQGTVSYISNAWGGRASDKHITENCGFLNNILPGDVVLADRGFDIRETIGCMMAEVRLPAFTRGKKQLSPLCVEDTRRIASVRIHVERIIGSVRQKYFILKGPLSVDYLIKRENDTLPQIDKIVTICCACINLSESIVDFT